MPVTPEGYTMGGGSTGTGRSAKSRFADIGKGRPSPVNREMPFARHMSLQIFVTNNGATTSEEAAQNIMDQWEAWKTDKGHATVQDLFFEFVTETKMALYVIYSE